jgi:tetratricopeptide (TPR) repeat protein
MPTPSTDPSNTEDPSLGTRLDSWKEIASWLRRGERTVKRWEAERGLPIHRVPGGGRGSVYAFTSELSDWLSTSQVPDPDGTPQTTPNENSATDRPTPPPPSLALNPLRKSLSALAALALACSAVLLAIFHHHHTTTPIATLPSTNHGLVIDRNSTVPDAEKALAHDLYMRGRYEWNQRTPDSLNRALDDFTQAVVHDPTSAPSYAGLADTYNLLHIYSTLPLSDSYPRALAAARRALQLDDSLPEAHRALAFALFYGAGNWVDSEKEFRRAVQLDPNDPVTRRWYGNAFAMPGRFDQSMQQFNKAQELDPASHSTLCDKGIVLFNFGHKDEGISLLKQVERTDPGFYSSHLYLMQIAFEQRDYPTFFDEGQKAAKIRNDTVLKDSLTSAHQGFAKNGEPGLLAALYAKQKEFYDQGKLPGGTLAITCTAMGKRQQALQLLDVEYTRHEADVLWVLTDQELRALHNEPQFSALAKKINFPPAP